MRTLIALIFSLLVGFASAGSGGCSDDFPPLPTTAPKLAVDGGAGVQVVLAPNVGAGLLGAAQDLHEAVSKIAGVAALTAHQGPLADASTQAVIVVIVGANAPASLGAQGHRISKREFASDRRYGLLIEARTETAAMWGLYRVIGDLGVRYIHPEDSFFPATPDAKLPWHYDGADNLPTFATRGLHEHTQHPIPASDFLLRQDDPTFRAMASRYIRWLARNRQNTFSFHMLKTIPLDTWIPYFKGIVDEARSFGVIPGVVVSFADEQQNNFKLIRSDKVDGGGNVLADDSQIRGTLDQLVKTGIGRVTFQLGTSEFTKPEDAQVLGWLQTAVDHLSAKKPPIQPFAWIHTTCSLKDDKGGYFYHLPLQSDARLGAWVHTTMFYDLEHPAPVYDCEHFHQQLDFIKAADGKRPLTYFPESAWWLGFDNNMPLALPITGLSRAWDINKVLPAHQVGGHITFTSGREWGYWRYDHYVMGAAWGGKLDWPGYLQSIKHLFGGQGDAVAGVLADWAELQRAHFYDRDPLLIFYLAGELTQDEIGEQAGILARRPKIAFKRVLEMDNAEFTAWQQGDFALLAEILPPYQALLAKLPETLSDGTESQQKLYRETRRVLWIYVQRIQHTIELYGAVIAMRPWRQAVQLAEAASPGAVPGDALKTTTQTATQQRIDAAKAITKAVRAVIADQEKDYRSPAALLTDKKPKSLTSYRFGYLEQAHTGHFWTRRDDQAQGLADKTFDNVVQAWKAAHGALFRTDKAGTKLIEPKNPTAQTVLASFMPPLLWTFGTQADELLVAVDRDDNKLPDGDSEQAISGQLDLGKERWTGQASTFVVGIQDAAGNDQGSLAMLDATFDLKLGVSAGNVTAINSATVSGNVGSKALLDILFAVGGIDGEGASNLLKAVFGVPADQPLPKLLKFTFAFTFEPAT